VSNTAETGSAPPLTNAVRGLGALLLGSGLIAAANSDIPSPLPWAYGLLPIGILWLARRVGLLLGTLAATSVLGAAYAAGVQDPARLFFVAVLAGSGLTLAHAARRGARASSALALAAIPVLVVAAGYLLSGGAEELTKAIAAQLDSVRRMETEHQLSQAFGLSATEFEHALEDTARLWTLLLPALFGIKWVLVMATNCWLASVLFQDGATGRAPGAAGGAFPAFSEFITWRVHPAAAWIVALALALMATRWKPAFDAGANLAFPLALAYTVQGFAVARYVALTFQIRGFVQAAILVLVFLMPILIAVVTAIGFFDAWFDFRKRATPDEDASVPGGDGRAGD
jgi:uncharacterized protein YybS (DUF2232 family)